MARDYATIARRAADAYEAAGQRGPTKVYFNGGTVPGELDRVYMEWTADTIESPWREGNVIAPEAIKIGRSGLDMRVRTWIEFYELMTPSKMVSDS